MIFFDLKTFLQENYQAISAIVLLGIIGLAAYLLHHFHKRKEVSFDEKFLESKSEKISICIDEGEGQVEKYFIYDKEGRYETIPIEAFYMEFDKSNSNKLKEWLGHISRVTDFNKTRRIEVVMYQERTNKRRVYLVELNCYIAELKKYYLTFKDITASMGLRQKITRVVILNDDEVFFKNSNAKNVASDAETSSYLVAFRFKEYAFAFKELQHEIMLSLQEKIYYAISDNRLENEIVCSIEDGTIVLFSTNVTNEKRFVSHIKSLIQNASKEYELIKHQFKYSVHLVGGYIKVEKDEEISMDTVLKAKTAADYIISSGNGNNKLQLFDSTLQKYYDETNKKVFEVEETIKNELFTIDYVPLIETKKKEVKGYFLSINIPQNLDMDYHTFIHFAKIKHLRNEFYKKVFTNIRQQKDKRRQAFYLPFDFDDIDRLFEAYNSSDEFQMINCYFCVEFSSSTLLNYDLISIEKKLASHAGDKIKFGLSYNTETPLYLNAKIYSKISTVLFRDRLIEGILDKYSIGALINVYCDVAKQYNHEIIGLNVDSIELYETLAHLKVNKVGGKFITQNIDDDRITDEKLLLTLNEIEKRPY